MGVLPVEPSKVRKRWRLQPGKIFLIDLIEKKIVDNEEIKNKYANKHNYESHLRKNQVFLSEIMKKKDCKSEI